MNLKSISTAMVAAIVTALPAFSQIKSGQAIEISILGVKAEEQGRINGVYPVSDAGMVNMPFVGQVKAENMRVTADQGDTIQVPQKNWRSR